MHRLLVILVPCALFAQTVPANYEDAYNLALTYLEAGATETSRQVIQALLQRQDKAELHNLLGEVEEREGHGQQSAAQYETAARMDPSEQNLFDLANELLLHRGFQPGDAVRRAHEFCDGKQLLLQRARFGLFAANAQAAERP